MANEGIIIVRDLLLMVVIELTVSEMKEGMIPPDTSQLKKQLQMFRNIQPLVFLRHLV